jgi:hypothetical protein
MSRITPESLGANPSEHSQQAALFCWAVEFAKIYPRIKWMFAIPNGGERNIAVASKLRAEGVKRGVPDIFFPIACRPFNGLFIEMKRVNGISTEVQVGYHEYLRQAGYKVVICNSWQSAVNQIKYYIGLETKGHVG